MKHEWRRHEKDLYGAKQFPRIVNIPAQQFIMTDGKGNPNGKDFSDKVSALYSLAYTIKMFYRETFISAPEAGLQIAGTNFQEPSNTVCDYTVYPLEAFWKKTDTKKPLDKNKLEYTVMIRQPDFITKDIFSAALERVKIKKPDELYNDIYFDTVPKAKCIEILHIGAYDDEPVSFQKMDLFAEENNLKRSDNYHKEIYMNHENHVVKSKLKTILRYCLE